MGIKIDNYDNMEKFIKDNIGEINKDIKNFTAKNLKKQFKNFFDENEILYTYTEIEVWLKDNFKGYLTENQKELNEHLNNLNASTKKEANKLLGEMANKELFREKDLKKYYERMILSKYLDLFKSDEVYNSLIKKTIKENDRAKNNISEFQRKYIKTQLEKNIQAALEWGLSGGFINDVITINTGTKTANDGDAAQFIFLARAILAGFTCANVDVRSCRYDAFIDYEGKLLRVQVKGIMNSSSSVSLKDRDRGGEGIDASNSRNKGKYISSEDCDLYVVVDKQYGICYIIPAKDVDKIIDSGKKSLAIQDCLEYKEEWGNIERVAKNIKSIN